MPHSTFGRRAAAMAPWKARLRTMAGALALAAAVAGGAAYAQLPPAQHYGQVEYVTGGIGIDESTAFKEAMPRYALALTFAERLGEKAAYVSDVQVVVRDKQDNTLLNADANGPYMLIQLPAGAYQVFATYQNKTLKKKVDVGATGSARAVFEWRD